MDLSLSKLSTGSGLGPSLRTARKSSGRTQGELAVAVGLSEKTIRMLEQGTGNLVSWDAVLEHLELEVVGRNLPSGSTLGEKLASLRKSRGLNQRELAAMVEVTQPTVVALELRGQGRVATLERILAALGAGAYLAPEAGRRLSTRTPGIPRRTRRGRRRPPCWRRSMPSSGDSTSTRAPRGSRGPA